MTLQQPYFDLRTDVSNMMAQNMMAAQQQLGAYNVANMSQQQAALAAAVQQQQHLRTATGMLMGAYPSANQINVSYSNSLGTTFQFPMSVPSQAAAAVTIQQQMQHMTMQQQQQQQQQQHQINTTSTNTNQQPNAMQPLLSATLPYFGLHSAQQGNVNATAAYTSLLSDSGQSGQTFTQQPPPASSQTLSSTNTYPLPPVTSSFSQNAPSASQNTISAASSDKKPPRGRPPSYTSGTNASNKTNPFLSCEQCGRSFSTRSRLLTHQRRHLLQKNSNTQCTVPQNTAPILNQSQPSMKNETIVSPTTPTMFPCPQCTRSFSATNSLRMHLKLKHKITVIEEEKGAHLTSPTDPHQTNHSNVSQHVRPTIYGTEGLESVLNEVQAGAPIHFEIAKNTFTMPSQIVNTSVQRGIAPPGGWKKDSKGRIQMYCCEICQRSFTFACRLTSHMRCHINDRPFRCTVCHQGFTQRGYLMRHSAVHTQDRPFTCPQCNRTYKHYGSLVNHRKLHQRDLSRGAGTISLSGTLLFGNSDPTLQQQSSGFMITVVDKVDMQDPASSGETISDNQTLCGSTNTDTLATVESSLAPPSLSDTEKTMNDVSVSS